MIQQPLRYIDPLEPRDRYPVEATNPREITSPKKLAAAFRRFAGASCATRNTRSLSEAVTFAGSSNPRQNVA